MNMIKEMIIEADMRTKKLREDKFPCRYFWGQAKNKN